MIALGPSRKAANVFRMSASATMQRKATPSNAPRRSSGAMVHVGRRKTSDKNSHDSSAKQQMGSVHVALNIDSPGSASEIQHLLSFALLSSRINLQHEHQA